MKSAFRIYDREVQPGSSVSFDLKVPELYVHSDLSTPVHVINGKREGPVLFISGAVHGDEIIGVEIVRRVLASKQLRNLKGTLIAIPVVNIFGFLNQSRYLPDRRDLNRSFPGSAKGSIASRMANLFFEQVVEKSAYGIDLHTAAINRENLPQVRANVEDAEVEGMARAFGLPVIVNSGLIEGSLRASAGEVGVKMIVYEAGEALRFDEKAIRAGVNGVLKVMQHLGMIRKSSRRSAPTAEPTLTNQSSWMRAPQSGIHRAITGLGAWVKEGDPLGYIADPLGQNETVVEATRSGVIIGRSNIPLVTEGEALFHIAMFDSGEEVAEHIEQVDESLDLEQEKAAAAEPPIV
jgi:hypothetical protein